MSIILETIRNRKVAKTTFEKLPELLNDLEQTKTEVENLNEKVNFITKKWQENEHEKTLLEKCKNLNYSLQ